MASLINFVKRVCTQQAWYWSPATADGYGGRTYGTPTLIKVRWEDKAEVSTSNDGREFTSSAQILTPQPLEFQGYVKLEPSLNPTQPGASPTGEDGAWEIKRTARVPLLKSSTEFINKVFV